MPPWEKYAPPPAADDAPAPAPAGPWAKYAAPAPTHAAPSDTGTDWNDVAHGIGKGLLNYSGEAFGMLGSAGNALQRGMSYAETKPLEWAGLMAPETGAEMRRRAAGSQLPVDIDSIQHGIEHVVNRAGINTDDAQTTAGKYAQTVASMVPGAAAMGEGSLPAMARAAVRYGVVPGALSETAGQATEGTALEPWARGAAAIAAGTPVKAVKGAWDTLSTIASPVKRTLKNATANVTPAQFDAAQSLMDQAKSAGVNLSQAEALSKVTKGATTLPEIQRSIEESRTGAPIMKKFYADRPDQVDALGKSTFDQIAPAPADPYALGPRVQDAAQGVMKDATNARTAEVNPHYTAAGPTTVPIDEMNAHLDQIDKMIARDKTGRLAPTLKEYRDAITETAADGSRTPITDIENLDRARKDFRDQAELPYGISPASLTKESSAKIKSLVGDDGLKGIMTRASPDFEQGLQKFQDISKNVVDPMESQPIGQLAKTDDFAKQNQILFNSKPIPGGHVQIGDAVRQIAAKDPEAASQSVRTFLEQQFDSATKGDKQTGGGKFYDSIYANDQQKRNIQAALRALPDGQVRAGALDKMMDILSAMKERLPGNSATIPKQEMAKALQSGPIPQEILVAAASFGKWPVLAKDLYAKYASGKNGAAFARILTSDDLSALRALNGAGSRSMRGQLLVAGLLAREGADTTRSGQTP